MPVQRPYNPDAKRIAELIQADLAKVGDHGEDRQLRMGRVPQAHRRRATTRWPLIGWTGDNGDPDNFFVPLAGCAAARPGGGNVAKWCNKEFEDLVRRPQRLPSQAERAKLYEQAQVIMHARRRST